MNQNNMGGSQKTPEKESMETHFVAANPPSYIDGIVCARTSRHRIGDVLRKG